MPYIVHAVRLDLLARGAVSFATDALSGTFVDEVTQRSATAAVKSYNTIAIVWAILGLNQ